jgi:RHS repeat-associated protein
MNRMIRTIAAAFFCCVVTPFLVAQVKPGQYANGSFDTKGFDTINLGNLNVMAAIPIINKPGRGGTNFTYTLAYNGAVWYPASVSGVETWVSTQNWGWQAQTEVQTGYVSYRYVSLICVNNGNFPASEILNVVYHDAFGGTHPFYGYIYNSLGRCPSQDHDGLSGGWSADGRYQYGGPKNNWILKDRSAHIFNVPEFSAPVAGYAAASSTDTNGNEISVDGSGNFTDTMGMKVLSVSGTAPSPVTMSFTDASGTARTATIDYTNHTVQTEFGCSGITEANLANVPLVSSVTMVDGSAYEFTYEQTPSPGSSGAVTGRVASITLPTGGTISYGYTGINNGVICADGSTAGLTRTTSADTGTSTWTYVRSIGGSNQSKTVITDGFQNKTDVYFMEPSTGGEPAEYYETGRNVFSGTDSGTPLRAHLTCYNGAPDSGACVTAPLALPINRIDNYAAYDGGGENGITVKFNTYGLAIERDMYDFGTATSVGGLLLKELWNYPASGIVNLLSLYQVYDASNNLASETFYTYDTGTLTTTSGLPQHVAASGPRGNMTAVTKYANASGGVGTVYAYDDAGTVRQTIAATAQASFTTNFTSFDSTDTFTTGATLPSTPSGIALTQGAAYDSNTGVPTSSTDPNGFQTVTTAFDPLNRPQQINYPDGGHAYLTYNPNYIIVQQAIDSSGARVDSRTHFDPYGRTDRHAQANGQVTNTWYQVDVCFDANGNASFQSLPYQGVGWDPAKHCSGTGDSTTYDALGRVTRVTHADGSYAQYSYHGRATQFTDENGVSRIMQVDGLGRTTTVCEISAAPMSGDSPAACNLDIAGAGFPTQYQYSTNNTTTILQGAQTRVMQTDWLGRVISLREPEVAGGTTPTAFTYTYNSTGLLVTRTRPRANQPSQSTLTTTTTQYDALGRILSVTYNDGTPGKVFTYDSTTYWAEASSQHNLKGRLSLAVTQQSSSVYTGTLFSYDPMGRVSNMWECQPSGCGNAAKDRALFFTYDLAGRELTQGDAVAGTIQYGESVAGELTSITNNTYNNATNPGALVSNIQNGPFGPTSFHLGNGLNGVMTYDPPTNSQFRWLCAGGVTASFCTGGTQLYGIYALWKGTYLTNGIDTIENTGGNYTYDALGHMTAYNGTIGAPVSYSWTYDRYGNRLSATPGANITVNKSYNTISGGGFYDDALGNETSDSVHTYSYDAENNLISVDSGSTAKYTYDALNQRVRIDNAQGSHEFTYDFAGRRVATWDANANTGIQGQIWWGSTPIAYRDSDGSTYFQQGDWLGTQRLLTNYAGSVVSAYTSRPWGEAYASTGKDDNISHYAGLEQSENTGIQHAQFRDYDSSLGRWLSPDSYMGSYDFTNPQSFNRFSYAGNAPNGNTDPSGQMFIYTPSPGGTGRGGVYFAVDPNQGTFGSNWDEFGVLQALLSYSQTQTLYSLNAQGGLVVDVITQAAINYTLSNFFTDGFTATLGPFDVAANKAPTQFDYWLQDVKHCGIDIGLKTTGDDMNPFTLSAFGVVGTSADVASSWSQASLAAVGQYSAQRGLTVPLRSSIVRAGMEGAEAFGKVAGDLSTAYIFAAFADGIRAELDQCF